MSNDPKAVNPYQPSIDPYSTGDVAADQRFVSGYVRELARWQTFFAVLASIGALIFLGMMVFQAIMEGDPATMITGLICPLMFALLFYVVPAVQLWRAVAAASRYANTGSSAQLSEFASSQLAFWRTVGILAALLLLMFVIFAAMGVFFAAQFAGVGN